MAKYLFIYSGGAMNDTPEAQEAAMAAWGQWFNTLGSALVDGGDPFLGGKTVRPDGSVSDGGSLQASGWSAVTASTIEEAASLAKGCPLLATGGTVDVYEAAVM